MTTGPTDVKVTTAAGGPDGMPLALKFNEGLGVAPRKTDVRRFMAVASKPHAAIAGTLADEIKAAIFKYEGQIPLALAIGVLRIVEKELLDDA